LDRAQQNRADPYPPPVIGTALGLQPQAVRNHLRTRQRDPTQFQGEQTTHGVDVEIVVELDPGQLADVFDGQPRGDAKVLVTQVFYRRRLRLVVLVGDVADDFFEPGFDAGQAGYRAIGVGEPGHVVAVALQFPQQRVQGL